MRLNRRLVRGQGKGLTSGIHSNAAINQVLLQRTSSIKAAVTATCDPRPYKKSVATLLP